MKKTDILQLKRAAVVMHTVAFSLKDENARLETLLLTDVIVKAARELELTQEEV